MNVFSAGFQDIRNTFFKAHICLNLAYDDLKLRYKRTVFGPFWATLLTGVNFALLTLVFGTIFTSDSSYYVPFLCIGLIFWQFIASVLGESGDVFTNSKGLMESVNLPYSLYAARLVLRNMIILGHNLVIVAIVLFLYPKDYSLQVLSVIPALLFWGITAFSLIIIIGIFATRYNDIKQFVNMIVTVGFLMSPIIWRKSFLTKYSWIIDFNPIYHYISIIREPLLGKALPVTSWMVVIVLSFVFLLLSAVTLSKFKHRIQFWF